WAEWWFRRRTKKGGALMPTTAREGTAANKKAPGMPPPSRKRGLEVVNLGLYPPLSEDFPAQIGQLKANNCEIACGIFNPPQFVTFWTQCAQQGYRPKIMTPPKALLFPSAVEALGNRGTGTSTEVWWARHHPFKSAPT